MFVFTVVKRVDLQAGTMFRKNMLSPSSGYYEMIITTYKNKRLHKPQLVIFVQGLELQGIK
jgi:hypothetical protein